MTCPTPISLPQPEGRDSIPVPCGKCGACMHSRRNDWTFRLKQELKASANAYFITFTYRDDEIPESINPWTGEYLQTLNKKHFQDFMKRLRDRQNQLTSIKIRYYVVGEYGTRTNRPHYHAIIFNLHRDCLENMAEIWSHGHVHHGKVTDASIHYVTKYHISRNPRESENQGKEREFSLMSKGIGKNYIESNSKWHIENGHNYVLNNGYKQRLPRYYREKIFSEDEKKHLSGESKVNSKLAYDETCRILLELGIQDPDEYIYQNQLEQAKKQKTKKSDKPTAF